MKKTALLLSFLFFAWLAAKGQNTFAPVGAEWWYGSSPFGSTVNIPGSWLQHVQSVGDTTIVGISCRKLTVEGTIPVRPSDAVFKNPFYIYDNTDTVFVFSERQSRFIPLYIFNVQQGDTVCLSGLFHNFGDSTFCYIVDSVGTELVGTSHLKAVYIHSLSRNSFSSVNWGSSPPTDPTPPWQGKGKYIERLGGVWPQTGQTTKPVFGSFFPALTVHPADIGSIKITDIPYGDFRCYSDATHFVKLDTVACDRQYLGLKDFQAATGCTVFPNPARDRLIIRADAAFELHTRCVLYNVAGQLLLERALPAGHKEEVLSLSGIPAGLYYMAISRGEGKYYQKIILHP